MQSEKTKDLVGFIGLGNLGLPIAANLLKSGYALNVHTRSRTAEKHSSLNGANPCNTPLDVAKSSNIIFTCVSDYNALENVIFGSDGAINNLKSGNIVIDLSTISYEDAEKIGSRLKKIGVVFLDSPVTGGTEGAIKGKLSLMIGGEEKIVQQITPLLKVFSQSINYFGAIGSGQKVKAINQVLVAGCYAAVAEAIALGQKQNLPMKKVINSLLEGAGSSWALKNRSEFMLSDHYPLGFKLSLHHKDLCIAIDSAKKSGLKLSITEKVKEIEEELLEEGYGDEDISILRRSIKTT